MWQVLAAISVLVCAAALISVVVGLIIGIARKRWKVLKYSSIVLGVSLALSIVAAILGSTFDDSTSAAAQPPMPTPTFEEVTQTAKRVSWEDLYRNNETYLDELVYLKGEVIQVISDGNSDRYELRVAVAEADGGYDFAEVVFVRYEGAERLLEDDVVEIVGNVEGLHTYFSLGGPQTIPEITDAKIRRSGAATITPLPTFTPEPIAMANTPSSATAETPASTNTPLPTFTPESTSVPTATPEPTATPLPTNTPAPTATPEPTGTPTPTHTPHPTHTPEPTAAPTLVPTSTPEPTATPIPIGTSEDNPIPYREKGLLANTDNFYLRVVSVTQGNRGADALFRNAPELDTDFTRVVVRIKVQNDGMRADNYNATRIRAFGLKSKQSYTEWWRPDDSNYCGHWLEASWDHYEDIAPGSAQTGNICFVVPKFDAGALLLVDNGGYRASYEDWRYWKLRE